MVVDDSRVVAGVIVEVNGLPLGRTIAGIDRVLITSAAKKRELSLSWSGGVAQGMEYVQVGETERGLIRNKIEGTTNILPDTTGLIRRVGEGRR